MDVCVVVCVDMGMDVCTDMSIDMCMSMCMGICLCTHMDMCIAACHPSYREKLNDLVCYHASSVGPT